MARTNERPGPRRPLLPLSTHQEKGDTYVSGQVLRALEHPTKKAGRNHIMSVCIHPDADADAGFVGVYEGAPWENGFFQKEQAVGGVIRFKTRAV